MLAVVAADPNPAPAERLDARGADDSSSAAGAAQTAYDGPADAALPQQQDTLRSHALCSKPPSKAQATLRYMSRKPRKQKSYTAKTKRKCHLENKRTQLETNNTIIQQYYISISAQDDHCNPKPISTTSYTQSPHSHRCSQIKTLKMQRVLN